ncbi:hypothetical protein, partial [Aneurinibacillus aneurinilyticus]|uniref:hypothetical protein n=1 Tax=Aneurinibacillus aneurinilyticus TaxID=1391 RepID=UPI003D205CC9
EAQMFCRSDPGATKRPCLFLVRKRRGNTPTRAPSFFHLMDNQQAWFLLFQNKLSLFVADFRL